MLVPVANRGDELADFSAKRGTYWISRNHYLSVSRPSIAPES